MCWHSERRSGCFGILNGAPDVCSHSERYCLFLRSFEEDVSNCKYDDATVVARMVAEFRKCLSHLTSSHVCRAILTEYREIENMSGVRRHNIRIRIAVAVGIHIFSVDTKHFCNRRKPSPLTLCE